MALPVKVVAVDYGHSSRDTNAPPVWIELQHLMADGIVVGATRNGYRVWNAA